jgi:hypothetical protein
LQEVLENRIEPKAMKKIRTGEILEIDSQTTLVACGLRDRDILSFEYQMESGVKRSSEMSQSTAVAAVAPSSSNLVREQQSLHPFVLSIQRSGIVPSNSLEALALAAHAILLQMGFICICERDTGNRQISGFAQPLSGDALAPPLLSLPLVLLIGSQNYQKIDLSLPDGRQNLKA